VFDIFNNEECIHGYRISVILVVVILVLSHPQEVTLELNKVVIQDQVTPLHNTQALAILVEANRDQVILVNRNR
jgi:hypothetical protein